MTVWCFQCGAEYEDDSVTECQECGVPTVDQEPAAAADVGDENEEQLAYELHAWAGTTRRMLDGMLSTAGIEHAWQGATLIIREADEEAVDEAISAAQVSTMPKLDPDQPTMVYELDEFSGDQVARVAAALAEEGIAHDFDGHGDLVINEVDEDAVDDVFDALDGGTSEHFTFGPGIDGVEAHEVLADLYLAVNSLKRNTGDANAVREFGVQADLVEQLQLPFGFSAPDWRNLLDQVEATRVGLTSTELEADEVDDLVAETWDMLRPLV